LSPRLLNGRGGCSSPTVGSQTGRGCDIYDQVWLFADNPGEEPAKTQYTPDSVAYKQRFGPVSDEEPLNLTRWDGCRRRGVRPADRSLLGRVQCALIPRVRTMRR
jgi:hypothetical protein